MRERKNLRENLQWKWFKSTKVWRGRGLGDVGRGKDDIDRIIKSPMDFRY